MLKIQRKWTLNHNIYKRPHFLAVTDEIGRVGGSDAGIWPVIIKRG